MIKRSLSIGINNYPGTSSDLHGCINDAIDWQNELLQKYGFIWQDTLHNHAAFKQAITDAIADIVVATQAGDLSVITYSGHGSWQIDLSGDEIDGRDEALCPYDYQDGLLTDDYLCDIFSYKNEGARIVVISDSCHSGSVTRNGPMVVSPFNAHAAGRYLAPSCHTPSSLKQATVSEKTPLKRAQWKDHVLLLSGCKDDEYSYDAWFNGRPAGAFTTAALWTLRRLPYHVTYETWFNHIREHLPSSDFPQTPQLQGTPEQKAWRVFDVEEETL